MYLLFFTSSKNIDPSQSFGWHFKSQNLHFLTFEQSIFYCTTFFQQSHSYWIGRELPFTVKHWTPDHLETVNLVIFLKFKWSGIKWSITLLAGISWSKRYYCRELAGPRISIWDLLYKLLFCQYIIINFMRYFLVFDYYQWNQVDNWKDTASQS